MGVYEMSKGSDNKRRSKPRVITDGEGVVGRELRPVGSPIVLLVCLTVVVIGVVFVVHLPALSAGALVFDDEEYLVNNRLVQNPSWSSAGRFFGEVTRPSTVRGYYQPLSMTSLMLDYAAGGRPEYLRPFHRTSLGLHLANTVLVIVLLYMVFGHVWAAALAGLLFGVHPITVEAIPWVAERKTVLATFFALWSLIFYVSYARRGGWLCYGACFLTCVLALLSKPTTTPLPALMLLMDVWPLRRFSWRAILEKGPIFVICGVSATITFISQMHTASVFRYVEALRPVWILCHNIVFYLYKVVWPVNPVPHYPFPIPLSPEHSMVLAGVIGTVVLILFLVLSLRWTRALMFGWLFFFVAIFPAIGVIGFTTTIAADRFAYLPMVGLLFIVTWFLSNLWSTRPQSARLGARRTVVVAVVLVLAGGEAAIMRNYLSHWRDSEGLCRYMLEIVPDAPIPHNNLASILEKKGRLDDALFHYLKAANLKPEYSLPHHNLVMFYHKQKRYGDSVKHFKEALRIKPDFSMAHNNLGVVYIDMGQTEKAIEHFALARDFDPNYAEPQINLANALCKVDKYRDAVGLYRDALKRFDERLDVYGNLGDALEKTGGEQEAVAFYRWAVETNKDNIDVLNTLGNIFYKRNQAQGAFQCYERVAELSPDSPWAHLNVALALARLEKTEEAVTEYEKALRLNPDYLEAHYCLANAFVKLKNYDEAIEHYNEAIRVDANYVNAWENLCMVMFEQRKFDEAVYCMRRIAKIRPNDANVRYRTGELLRISGNRDKAIIEYEEALKIDPDYGAAREVLGKLKRKK